MNESDEFRQQVEELKQRLGATQAQHDSQAGAMTQRLASIKLALRQKQEEIARLSAENQQLRIMLDEVIALLNQREDMSSGQMINGFFDEIAEFIEGDETPTPEMPDFSISAPPAPSAWSREDEPASINTSSIETSSMESESRLPIEPSASDEMKAESLALPEESAPAPMPQPESEAARDEAEEDEEEVPALKRILKRGQRGR